VHPGERDKNGRRGRDLVGALCRNVEKPRQRGGVVLAGGPFAHAVDMREIGIADISIKRWFMSIPEDEKLRLVAQHLERARLAETERAAAVVTNLGDDVVTDLKWVLRELKRILEESKDDEDRVLQLGTLRETHKVLNSLANIFGLVSKKVDVTIDINNSPAVLKIREVILNVLEQHPEAQADFLREMQRLQVIEAKAIA